MARDLPVGNGNLLVTFDTGSLLRDLYFPKVGEENHTKGEQFRFGVHTPSGFGWVPDGWTVERNYLPDSLVTEVRLTSPSLGIRITRNDAVDFHENIFVQKLVVENLFDEKREIRLFFCHDFHIYGNEIGDTAEFRPERNGILHYKSDRYFFVRAFAEDNGNSLQFATGNKVPGLFEGTWKDAEDGILGGNPIAQGSVDSVLGVTLKIEARSTKTCYHTICCGKNWTEVEDLDQLIKKRGPSLFLKRTENYWKLWVNKESVEEDLLPPDVLSLYKKSLVIARSQINNSGSIIAGNDSDVMQFNRDTYSYMWPRDGAFIAHAFDLAGYDISRNFYRFCNEIIEKQGYFLHKYTPSGMPGSSWHARIVDKKPRLPIQEDETALVLFALWEHYKIYRDVEFIKPLYRSLIKRSADFLMSYRDPKTELPLPSYDLWEEREGIATFTVSTVYGGLIAAAKFTRLFGEEELAADYEAGAAAIRSAMDRYLYLEKEKRFARLIRFSGDGSWEVDNTVDASLYGVFAFGPYSPFDDKVGNTMRAVYETLRCPEGGLSRYENDPFHRSNGRERGNPWFVTTLWFAQYLIAIAKGRSELQQAREILEWVARGALPSGVLAEQINAVTKDPLSVSPLTWSHGTYITTVRQYIEKWREIDKCPSCGGVKIRKNPELR